MDMVPFNPSIGIEDNRLEAWPGICTAFQARDGLFVVQVAREHQFERLARAVGHPEWLADERFARREGWRDHRETVLRPAIEAWASTRSRLEASRELALQGVAAGPCYDGEDLAVDPHVRGHEMVLELPRPDGAAPLRVAGNPIKGFEGEPPTPLRWPRLGEHTDRVLRTDLGLCDEELAALRRAGTIG